MNYELMMNGDINIGQKAPDFDAITTYGNRSLNDYKGSWLVFFSHPGDFTPVCTTEMIAFSKAYDYFKQINTELLGLSIDSISSHLAWMNDIYNKTGIVIPFPIIADRSGKIARNYGMISKDVSETETVRDVIIIDSELKIRTILTYPLNIGRNIQEIWRIVKALQTSDCSKLALPANWLPNEPGIIHPPKTYNELAQRNKYIKENHNGLSWYLSFQNIEDKCLSE